MQTVNISYIVYEFQELSDEAKENVRQWYLDGQDSSEFTHLVDIDLQTLFPNSDLKVEYSLGYCQGDGLNIYGDVHSCDILNLIDGNDAGDLFKDYRNIFTAKEIKTLKFYQSIARLLTMPRNPTGYSYCYAEWASPCDTWREDLEDLRNVNWDLIDRFEEVVKNVFTLLCDQHEEAGYNYFYEVNDETLEEVCEANDYHFLEDGSYFNM